MELGNAKWKVPSPHPSQARYCHKEVKAGRRQAVTGSHHAVNFIKQESLRSFILEQCLWKCLCPLRITGYVLAKESSNRKSSSSSFFFKQKDGCSTFAAFFCDHRQLSIVYYLLALFKKKNLKKKNSFKALLWRLTYESVPPRQWRCFPCFY